jgi:hypothetical protein
MALYPEKYVFDVAGFPKVLAKDLVRDMAAQRSGDSISRCWIRVSSPASGCFWWVVGTRPSIGQ